MAEGSDAPANAAETPTKLQQAAAGMAEAQAWKGQQIANGWHKVRDALRLRVRFRMFGR